MWHQQWRYWVQNYAYTSWWGLALVEKCLVQWVTLLYSCTFFRGNLIHWLPSYNCVCLWMYVCLYFQLQLYASQLISNPKIDNTYKAKGFNLITLRRDLYTDVTFYGANHPNLLYCFQFLFPFLVIILVVMYSCWWLMKECNQDDWAVDPTYTHVAQIPY